MSTIIKSVTLDKGEQFILPPGARILFTTNNNAVESSCGDDIPNIQFKCARFGWETNVQNINFQDAYFSKITIGTVEYPLTEISGFPTINYYDNGSEAEKLAQTIHLLHGNIITVIGFDQGVGSVRGIKLQYPDIGKITLTLVQPTLNYGNTYLELQPFAEPDCNVPSGWYKGHDSANGTA